MAMPARILNEDTFRFRCSRLASPNAQPSSAREYVFSSPYIGQAAFAKSANSKYLNVFFFRVRVNLLLIRDSSIFRIIIIAQKILQSVLLIRSIQNQIFVTTSVTLLTSTLCLILSLYLRLLRLALVVQRLVYYYPLASCAL